MLHGGRGNANVFCSCLFVRNTRGGQDSAAVGRLAANACLQHMRLLYYSFHRIGDIRQLVFTLAPVRALFFVVVFFRFSTIDSAVRRDTARAKAAELDTSPSFVRQLPNPCSTVTLAVCRTTSTGLRCKRCNPLSSQERPLCSTSHVVVTLGACPHFFATIFADSPSECS